MLWVERILILDSINLTAKNYITPAFTLEKSPLLQLAMVQLTQEVYQWAENVGKSFGCFQNLSVSHSAYSPGPLPQTLEYLKNLYDISIGFAYFTIILRCKKDYYFNGQRCIHKWMPEWRVNILAYSTGNFDRLLLRILKLLWKTYVWQPPTVSSKLMWIVFNNRECSFLRQLFIGRFTRFD